MSYISHFDLHYANIFPAVVASDVVLAVAELLLLLRLIFSSACLCIRQRINIYTSMVGLDSSASRRVIVIAGVE